MNPIPLGSTVIEMIREGLKDPIADPSEGGVPLNFDGNNRDIQESDDREVRFYDVTKGCGSDDDNDALKKYN